LFGDTAEYFVASWVTTDLREDVQEVDFGALHLDSVHALQRPGVPERMFRSGWTLMRPPYDANPPG
jgi:hypothetical protein